MKYKSIVCAVAAAALSIGSMSAFAQGRDGDRGDNNRNGHDQRGDNRNDHRNDNRNDNRGDHRGQMGNRGDRADHYAYGARGPEWRRGGHIPPQYRERQYVVSDWRGHHLNAPPRGYQWVQVGSDYVLVAIATGIIAQLLLNQ